MNTDNDLFSGYFALQFFVNRLESSQGSVNKATCKVVEKGAHPTMSQDSLVDRCCLLRHCNYLALSRDEGVGSGGKGERSPLTKPIVELDLTPLGGTRHYQPCQAIKVTGTYHAGPTRSETLRVP